MNTKIVTDAIPFAAWEQAVFVALFIVFVIGLLGWFSKQSDKWQKFMFDIDEKWREFSRQQRIENNNAMENVEKSLVDLTKVTEGMLNEVKKMSEESNRFHDITFANHDEQAKEILDVVKSKKKEK